MKGWTVYEGDGITYYALERGRLNFKDQDVRKRAGKLLLEATPEEVVQAIEQPGRGGGHNV